MFLFKKTSTKVLLDKKAQQYKIVGLLTKNKNKTK